MDIFSSSNCRVKLNISLIMAVMFLPPLKQLSYFEGYKLMDRLKLHEKIQTRFPAEVIVTNYFNVSVLYWVYLPKIEMVTTIN